MIGLLISWVVSAIALYLVTQIVPGVTVSGPTAALIAALVIGLINATLGNILKLLTLPIGCLTLGLSSLIINAFMFLVAANLVPGFHVDRFWHALIGSIVMSIVNGVLHLVIGKLTTASESQPK